MDVYNFAYDCTGIGLIFEKRPTELLMSMGDVIMVMGYVICPLSEFCCTWQLKLTSQTVAIDQHCLVWWIPSLEFHKIID